LVGALDFWPGGNSARATAPVDQHGALRRSAAIPAQRIGSRVSRNGNADSGQIRWVTSRTPSIAGRWSDPKLEVVAHHALLGAVIELVVLLADWAA